MYVKLVVYQLKQTTHQYRKKVKKIVISESKSKVYSFFDGRKDTKNLNIKRNGENS